MTSLARRVYHILSNKWTEDNFICDVWRSKKWTEVTSGDIVKVNRTATKPLKLKERGIYPNMIGVHSLQAGRAMSLKLMGYKDYTIRKFGLWTSDTWTMYIQSQIAKLLEGVAQKMSTPYRIKIFILLIPLNDNNGSIEN